jgi:hypothetical protein
MKPHPGPGHNMSPEGFFGFLLALLVLLGVGSLFTPRADATLFGSIAVGGIIFAIGFRFYVIRKSRKEHSSEFHTPNHLEDSELTDMRTKQRLTK